MRKVKIMKKVIALVLAIVVILSTTVMAFAADKKYRGDVNGDGEVTAVDAREVLRVYVNDEILDFDETQLADMNKDGNVTVIDARMILQVAVGEKEKEEIKDSIDWGDI